MWSHYELELKMLNKDRDIKFVLPKKEKAALDRFGAHYAPVGRISFANSNPRVGISIYGGRRLKAKSAIALLLNQKLRDELMRMPF